MNGRAIVVSFVIALAVSLFNGVYPFSLPLFYGIFAVWAIVFHLTSTLSSRLLDKINEAEKDYSDDESHRRIDSPS